MQWAVFVAAFLASAVELVEAFTIVLVVGITINWRSSLLGALLAAATLALIVATFGVALVTYVPIDTLRIVVGIILILFGLKWLKKAILRYSKHKALHDEEAIYEEKVAELRARGEATPQRLDTFGTVLSYKAVLLEGLEVAFIVITFGSNAALTVAARASGIASAAVGAAIAGMLVILLGALVRAPLTKIPENTLKFIVGLMLTTFGTYWTGEGFGIKWPLPYDAFLIVLLAIYLLSTFILITTLGRHKQQPQPTVAADTRVIPHEEEVRG